MKVKTSVSLSAELLAAIDEAVGTGGNRSEFIEKALRRQLREIRRAERNARDSEIYARLASDPQHQGEVEEVHRDWPEVVPPPPTPA
jgi:Arc/MetJ-type ribon-helix-helix transcriptional regulator